MTTQLFISILSIFRNMKQKIDVKQLMEGTPRPHYLCGIGEYNKEGNQYNLSTKVNFTSEGHPSILDRNDKYVSKPHVNAGDCCFALWNAVHIIAELNGCGSRILRKKIIIEPKRLIPPDTDLNLEAKVIEKKELVLRGKPFSVGKIYGSFYQDGKELISITADYCAEK